MSVKGVVEVHSCYNIELGEPRPILCACRKIVSISKANELVKLGGAEWVIGYDRPKPYHDGGKICLTGRMNQTPRAATIDDVHISRAYIDGYLEEKARIEEYGMLSKIVLDSITTIVEGEDFRREPWNNPDRMSQVFLDWGIPVVSNSDDMRTEGGIHKDNR